MNVDVLCATFTGFHWCVWFLLGFNLFHFIVQFLVFIWIILYRRNVWRWRTLQSISCIDYICDSLVRNSILLTILCLASCYKLRKIFEASCSFTLHNYHQGITSFKFFKDFEHLSSFEQDSFGKDVVVSFVGVWKINTSTI